MALKDWLGTGKCLLGFHEGQWARENPRSCVLVQTCVRCHAISQQLEHDWAEWNYVSPQTCEFVRPCQRCGEKETRVEHQWGSWSYRHEKACEQGIRCARCSAWAQENRIEHEWGDWEYNEQYRAPLHRCTRCALLASYFPDHRIDPSTGRAPSHEAALAAVQEMLADDKAIEDLLQRAQGQAHDAVAGPREAESPGNDDEKQEQDLKALWQMYEEQLRDGAIPPGRRPLLTSIMTEVEDILRKPSLSIAENQISARRIQDALLRLRELVLSPSRGTPVEEPTAGTRLALIAGLHGALFHYVYTETTGGLLTGEEGRMGVSLLGQLRDSREAIAALSPSGDPLKMEYESLRQFALDVRNFSLRHHLTLIRPLWPTHTVAQNPGAIFYSGDAEIGNRLEQACVERRLHRLIPQPTREPASLRWNQLREAALTVFDFTGFKRNSALEEASTVATVAYELGIALALGRPVVIVALENQDLPFDLDIEPIRLPSRSEGAAALGLALDQGLYELQRGRAGTSVAQSIQYLRARFQNHANFRVRQALASIDDDAVRDPVKARLLIESLLGFLSAEAPQIAFPTWPGSYPHPTTKRCFHVTAYGPTWANTTSHVVKQACGTKVVYVRGDQEILAPDILRSIWDEICRATHLIVDLTGLNANVILELGIAHALGRNVMLISQDQQPEKYFRAIAKQRIHHYAVDGGKALADLEAQVKKFLSEESPY